LDSATIEAIEPRIVTILESSSALGVKVSHDGPNPGHQGPSRYRLSPTTTMAPVVTSVWLVDPGRNEQIYAKRVQRGEAEVRAQLNDLIEGFAAARLQNIKKNPGPFTRATPQPLYWPSRALSR
jgi:hypothetical protein